MAQITQVTGSPQTATTTNTTLTITKPSGLAVGDLMLVNIMQNDNDNNTLSDASRNGWIVIDGRLIGGGGTNDWWGTLLYKIADASDVASANFAFTLDSDADDGVGGLVAFSGVDNAMPFDVATGTYNLTNSDDLSATSITTASPGAAVIMFGVNADNESYSSWATTSPGTLTELFDVTFDADLDMSVGAAWAIKTIPGSTGTGIAEISDSDNDPNGAILIALKDANPTTTVFAASDNFIVPAGVSCVRVQAWGGGGGGGVNDATSGNGGDGAGGGGGGGYREGVLMVMPGDNITISVGTGGAGAPNIAGSAGSAGGNSVVTHSSGVITANGGGAGLGTSGSGGVGAGGTGSFTGSVYGQVSFNGGTGGQGDDNEGGGGGGGAGTTQNGNGGGNPGGGNGGNASGGNGGGGGNDGAGSPGSPFGGGGGGAGDDGGGGGGGADGYVIISWNLSSGTPGTITAGSPASSCASPFDPPNISGNNPSGAETWVWQSSTDGGSTWTDVATTQSYNPGNITTTTQYRRVRVVTGECPAFSNVVTYSVYTPPTASISGTLSFCAGGSTTLTASGGSSYEWDDNSTNAMRSVSAAGTYTVTVTDANGCTDTETATVTENPLPTASISGALSFCAGSSTTLTASGGTTYLWDDNSTNAMRTISAAGTYTVQVTDGNGCTDTETATVSEISTPTCNITSGPTTVCPNSTGHSYTATGGGTYLWSIDGNGTIDGGNTGSSVTVDAGATGTYTITVTVTDNGCTSSCSQEVTVEDNIPPSITCPANITVNTPSNSCEATGVALGSPVVSDNCSTTVSNDASEPYALGNTVVTWTVSDGTNSAVCLQIVKVNPYVAPAGEYFDLGTCMSTPCPPGTYCPGGTTAGIPCPAGTSQGLSGQSACVDCLPGYYSSTIGATACTACAAGSYSDITAATECTACPYGTSSTAGSSSCTPLDPQQISVFGNGNQIVNRASTVSVSDDTDFGAVGVGNMVTRTFTIYNIVNAVPLKLTGNPSVEIADKNASDFSVTVQPSLTSVPAGGSTTFTVKFQPTATGLRTAIVMIASDDYPENPFVFTIEGTGL